MGEGDRDRMAESAARLGALTRPLVRAQARFHILGRGFRAAEHLEQKGQPGALHVSGKTHTRQPSCGCDSVHVPTNSLALSFLRLGVQCRQGPCCSARALTCSSLGERW